MNVDSHSMKKLNLVRWGLSCKIQESIQTCRNDLHFGGNPGRPLFPCIRFSLNRNRVICPWTNARLNNQHYSKLLEDIESYLCLIFVQIAVLKRSIFVVTSFTPNRFHSSMAQLIVII